MKKILLLTMIAFLGLTASAQSKHFEAKAHVQSKSQVTMSAQKLMQPMQVAGHFNGGEIAKSRLDKKVNINTKTLVPALQQKAKTMDKLNGKAFSKGMASHRRMVNLQPTMKVQPQAAQAKGPRNAAELSTYYTGKGYDYFEEVDVEWSMAPSTATITQDSVETEYNVMLDVIPVPSFLSDLYPNGIPVVYTVDDNIITIEPQAVASYQNEAKDTTYYITLFAANSDDEDGLINMEIGEGGKLKVINGNWICFGEFANVEFDEDLSDSEAYLGLDELIADVRYLYEGQKDGITVEKEFNAYGIDAETNELVNWTLQQGTFTYDDEDTPILVNLLPLIEDFAGIYPDGIYVEYTQSGNIITVKPQQIASYTASDGTKVYLLLHSNTSDDGNIVLTLAADGTPETINDESICIGAWETKDFDASYDTYKGYYSMVNRVKYQLPGAAPLAPEDVACEHANTILFAGMGISGYHYLKNLSVAGAYAPVNFKNITQDPASGYDWSIEELGEGDDVRTINGNSRDFTVNTIGGYGYQELKLTCDNQGSKGDTYRWGCMGIDGDTGEALFDSIFVYAGGSQSTFIFSDETYATMTNKNLDDDVIFYTNWGTPDKTSTSISKIYSYQGKPSSPLYITGVCLPFVGFTANEDFNLHVKLYKCTRDANGRVALGDVIAEGDAYSENIDDTYANQSGITAVNFDELYIEDEMGLSESVDYLFIEDEWLICIEGWDNGTFSGVLGSDDKQGGESITTWFETTEEEGSMYRYTSWKPTLFIGLIDATYGYLHTEDNTDVTFGVEGGEATIHVQPMYYAWDEENEDLPVPSLYVENIYIDGEEEDEVPEWLNIDIANLDQSVDEEGYPNNIDYDLVFTADALEEGVESRTVEIVYMQRGARLKVTITQSEAGDVIEGDVNGDGSVDVADISAIISVMAGTSEYAAADVNGDGTVDVADISAVISIMAGTTR